MAHYKDLIAWKKGMDLVEHVYRVTEELPSKELYGLTSQLRRAAVSVPSNIAEGQARYSKRDFRHFLRTARASLAEIETQLLVCERLGYLPNESCQRLISRSEELSRIISGLITSLKIPAQQEV